MGGCASKPKDLDGLSSEPRPVENTEVPEVTVKSVDADSPSEEIKTETTAENETKETTAGSETKEEQLVDLSEVQKPEAEVSQVEALAPGISELTVNAPPAEKAEATEKADEVKEEEKAENPKESEVAADEKKEVKADA